MCCEQRDRACVSCIHGINFVFYFKTKFVSNSQGKYVTLVGGTLVVVIEITAVSSRYLMVQVYKMGVVRYEKAIQSWDQSKSDTITKQQNIDIINRQEIREQKKTLYE